MAAYTHRATGTVATSATNGATLAPGAPAGKAVGDLLILPTVCFLVSNTVATPSNWTKIVSETIGDNPGPTLAVFARIADGGADDTPTLAWAGSSGDSCAAISAFHGDVFTDLANIVAHSASGQISGSNTNLGAVALTITTDDTLVCNLTVRRKTATADDATLISHAQFTKRWQDIQAGTALFTAFGTIQQSTATNYDGTVWTRDGTGTSGADVNVTFALKTQAAAAGKSRLIRSKLLSGLLLKR